MKYEIIEKLRNVNLADVEWDVLVDPRVLSKKKKKILEDEGYPVSSEHWTEIWMPDMVRLAIPYVRWHFMPLAADKDASEALIYRLIRPAEAYLVFTSHSSGGGNEYEFVWDVFDCFRRPYTVDITAVRVSKGGKVLICKEEDSESRELLRDRYWGSMTYIVALTEREYYTYARAPEERVEAFVNTLVRGLAPY